MSIFADMADDIAAGRSPFTSDCVASDFAADRLPADVLAILESAHVAHVRLMQANRAYGQAHPQHKRLYGQFVLEDDTKAHAIRAALRRNGHADAAQRLAAGVDVGDGA